MTREEEYQFLATLSSAMGRSEDVAALDRLWRAYDDQIAQCSPAGQVELEKLRARRSAELMNERTKR
jgi:hypothetical protein